MRVLHHQWQKCDTFRYNNWPGPVPEDVPAYQAVDFPAYQIERWRALANKEIPNPNFVPDGITLVGPLTQKVYDLLIERPLERPPQDRICAWFDVELCRGEDVLFHIQEWGSYTKVDMDEEEWTHLNIPSAFVESLSTPADETPGQQTPGE